MMFRKQFAVASSLLAVSFLVMALAAKPTHAKETKTINARIEILSATSLGGKAVEPGTYQVLADGSTVTLKMGKKVVAEASAQLKDGTAKPTYSSIVKDDHGIKEFHFEGKTSYVQVME
jgi:hypothetical protein